MCCGVDRVWGAFCVSICERLGWLARGYVPLGFAFDFVQSSNYWNYNCNSEWFHLDFFFGARGELDAKGVRFEWSFLVGSGRFYFGLKWLCWNCSMIPWSSLFMHLLKKIIIGVKALFSTQSRLNYPKFRLSESDNRIVNIFSSYFLLSYF